MWGRKDECGGSSGGREEGTCSSTFVPDSAVLWVSGKRAIGRTGRGKEGRKCWAVGRARETAQS